MDGKGPLPDLQPLVRVHEHAGRIQGPERPEGAADHHAGSGMATGGRILHHLKRRLPDPTTTVLFPGYQAAGTRGHSLVQGARQVKMHGGHVPVHARVQVLDGLSAHADRGEILKWLSMFKRKPRLTCLVHGEPRSLEDLASEIRRVLQWEVEIPTDGQRVGF